MKFIKLLIFALCIVYIAGCNFFSTNDSLFRKIKPEDSGIKFINKLEFRQYFNIYTYRNFYNGGGVGLADINNDGLIDIYFTSNMGDNKLYLNQGGLKFRDITDSAGVSGKRAWSTGVSMADVNGDGWIDIYVSNAGIARGDDQQNELFINNGDLTFTEKASEYGLADQGLSIHASFFDYDRDGDLDMYLVNNSFKAIGEFDLEDNLRNKRDPKGGDKLFRNDEGYFTDVSEQAGILGSVIAFGLGVTVGDINQDGWLDIYISNDFFERDYLYVNNGDGTFSEELEKQMRSISAASMGADAADINNDGWIDLFVTEMLPEYDARLKTVTTFEDWTNYQEKVRNGYYHQFTRNMLHLNNGNNTFSEIGRLAGVEATDWSWGALIADFNNDAKRDIFVSNGVRKDLTNQDYLQYIANPRTVSAIINRKNVDFRHLIDTIPSNLVPNYIFENKGNLKFENKAKNWGIDEPTHSNGSAYGDLDNDGDLDLVLNNLDMPSFIYENRADRLYQHRNSLQIELKGNTNNTQAVGAKVIVKNNGKSIFSELIPMRGFQSSVDPRIHIGLDTVSVVDSLIVKWPEGKETILREVKTNQILTIKPSDNPITDTGPFPLVSTKTYFSKVDNQKFGVNFKHKENTYNAFKRNELLFHMNSTEGPALCSGDINNDNRTDFYVGGGKGQSGAMFVQNNRGKFNRLEVSVFELDQESEDIDCEIFDANGDIWPDLYVGSGGEEFSAASRALKDRLYINDGTEFTLTKNPLPVNAYAPTSTVEAADFDNDGDIDLFVGSQFELFKYGLPASGYILENNGHGVFTDITKDKAEELIDIGLISDAKWIDIKKNGKPYLLVAGKWMSLKLFENNNGIFKDITAESGLENYKGWWNTVEVADVNQDGKLDIIAGNLGLNSRFKASKEKPMRMYVYDFDYNGSIEQIITRYEDENAYTLVLRHNLLEAIPRLKSKYPTYADFKNQKITDIFLPQDLDDAHVVEMNFLEHAIFLNNGNETFSIQSMPIETQFTPIYAIKMEDINRDGTQEMLTGGNLFSVKPEMGPYDAGVGGYLIGKQNGEFLYQQEPENGLTFRKQVRNIKIVHIDNKKYVLFANNNDSLYLFRIEQAK